MAERTASHNEFIEIVKTMIDNNIFKEDEKEWHELSELLLRRLEGDINPRTLADIMEISLSFSYYLRKNPGITEEDKVNRHELSKIMWKAHSALKKSANNHAAAASSTAAAATAHQDKRRRLNQSQSESNLTPAPSNEDFQFHASGESIDSLTNLTGGKKKNRTKRHRKKDIKMRRKSKSNTKSKRKNKTRTKRS
jgi:hypothetical protein